MKKVTMYCQLGKAVDMADFSIKSAINNAGLSKDEFDLVFICWKTSDEAYKWIKDNNWRHVDMEYDEGKGFLWNLYKGWNLGYTEGYKTSNYVCPIATDHAFAPNWLANLVKHARSNRIVNCKLIEPGVLPTLPTAVNLGETLPGKFNEEAFVNLTTWLAYAYKDCLVDDRYYGRRLDAMPFICPKDVWERFGPMSGILGPNNITGDTDFFDRCKSGGVEILKALDAISYHCGGLETKRNTESKVYT